MFKDIPLFPDYEITEEGVIRLKKTGQVLPWHKSNGYVFIKIIDHSGRPRSIGQHRLLAMTFIKSTVPFNNLDVNHINGIRNDNRLSNLEWVTRSDNNIHAVENGLMPSIKCTATHIETGKEYEFPTVRKLKEFLGYTRTIRKEHCVIGRYKVRLFRKEYLSTRTFKMGLYFLARNIYTGDKILSDNVFTMARLIGVCHKVLTRRLANQRFEFPINGYDVLIHGTFTNWPEYSDEELDAFKNIKFIHNPIWVTNLKTGERRLFGSVLGAAEFTGMHERQIRQSSKTGECVHRGFLIERHRRKFKVLSPGSEMG